VACRLDENGGLGCGAKKKPPDWLAVFRVSGCLRVLSTLSIRQRSEMPEKVKIKLRGGHGGMRSSG
jgi:hypothetical protein